MSGLQNFLAPFSHLLFANRNVVIVLLCAGLFWVALDALIHRWRAARLETDLASAKSGTSMPVGRRYAPAAPVEAPPTESGALPPVKGGRTYARNLGSALNKAGMAGPQIYSPPTPAGWSPNTNPQPAPQQPGTAPPYATPNAPWAAPAQQPQAPWAYPAGAGRGMPGQPPTPAPYYQPPISPPPQPRGMPQPSMPPSPAPGPFGPLPSAPFGQPGFPAPTSGPSAPQFAPPGAPMVPAGAPPYQVPGPALPGAEPAGADGGRRGKPKRRRFNFNVLENLEKMVQARPAEAPPSTGWTPPVTPPAPPSAPPVAPSAAETMTPAKPAEPESLPLQFGPPADTEPAMVETEPEVVSEKPAAVEAQEEPSSLAPEPEAQAEPEPAPEPEPEPKVEPRRSMRAMLFGEETAPAPSAVQPTEPEPEAAQPEPETEPVPAESSWPSHQWTREETSESDAMAAPSPSADEAPVEVPAETTPEPVAESASSTSFDPWRSTLDTEEPATEAVVDQVAEPTAEVPAAPAEAESNGSGAGTIVIIEDDQTAASYYATLFRGNGYRVEVANDGVSGVDLCARVQPQVILLDVMMPRQNGILVLQTLRASDETKNTPVVVMSNFSEPTLIKRAIQLGALEYVIKTQVEGPALLNALPRWMNREKAFAAA